MELISKSKITYHIYINKEVDGKLTHKERCHAYLPYVVNMLVHKLCFMYSYEHTYIPMWLTLDIVFSFS